MANLRPRQIVPSTLEWVDDDQYSPGGGVPTNAMLGRKLIRNDRALSAHCLRGFGQAFALHTTAGIDLPRIVDQNGTIIGPWPHWTTAGTASGEFYLRAALPAEATALVVPFVAQPSQLQPLTGPVDDAAHTITGAAAGAITNYGPFAVRLSRGAMRIGLAIYPTQDGVAYQSGDVDAATLRNRQTFRTDAAGATLITAWVTAGTEYDHVIRLASAAGDALSPWKQIISLSEDANANDTVTFWPPLEPSVSVDDLAKGALVWQSAMMNPVEITSIMFRERPPIGEYYPTGIYRG